MATKKPNHIKDFEAAIQKFWKGKIDVALTAFQAIAEAEEVNPQLKYSAESHAAVCKARLESPEAEPQTAAEFYLAGVAALNNNETEASIKLLNDAIAKDKANDAYVYTLANAYAVKGDENEALAELQKAVAMNSDNKVYAQNSEDFIELAIESEVVAEYLSED
jgi:tetratricopeptide (TPR) repeat protein